jgi:hypothetical protein
MAVSLHDGGHYHSIMLVLTGARAKKFQTEEAIKTLLRSGTLGSHAVFTFTETIAARTSTTSAKRPGEKCCRRVGR